MSKANEKHRNGELFSAWSMDGTIYVKTSLDGRPIKILKPETSRICSLLKSFILLEEGTDSVYLELLSLVLLCVVWIAYMLQ